MGDDEHSCWDSQPCENWGGGCWRQDAKCSRPQNASMWRLPVPFTTKCFFVRFQWSCDCIISRRIGGEDPGGQQVL